MRGIVSRRKDGSFAVEEVLLMTGMKKLLILLAGCSGSLVGETTRVFVGTSNEGLFQVELDEKTGALTNRQQLVKASGMGFQELNADGSLLYSTIQQDGKGAVASYRVTDEGMQELSVQRYDGRGLCHVSLDRTGTVLFGADYGGGLVVSFPVADGVIGKNASLMRHEGSGPNKQRQEGPHAHSMYAGPDNRFAYAPDLGIDQVKFYSFGNDGHLSDQGGFAVPGGSGPRHMKFGKSGEFAYVLNELSLTVSGFKRDSKTGKLTLLESVKVLPTNADATEMSCSEIRVSADGRFLYTANRDLRNEKRDSVSVLAVGEDGKVRLIAAAPAEVWIPRNINLSPSGDWLLVAGQRSNEVTSHRIDKKSGKLTFSGNRIEMPAAMCINFER